MLVRSSRWFFLITSSVYHVSFSLLLWAPPNQSSWKLMGHPTSRPPLSPSLAFRRLLSLHSLFFLPHSPPSSEPFAAILSTSSSYNHCKPGQCNHMLKVYQPRRCRWARIGRRAAPPPQLDGRRRRGQVRPGASQAEKSYLDMGRKHAFAFLWFYFFDVNLFFYAPKSVCDIRSRKNRILINYLELNAEEKKNNDIQHHSI